jgi:pSer/pThr/pTyr-binding forkhead associated (FHA) protein
MAFQLKIAEGKEAGREFLFEQGSVVIGRTSECDVVVYDPGVSRKHARIFADGDGYFVEDMGSSNGTKVNGNIVQRQRLNTGDSVSLGPVVFNFSAAAPDHTARTATPAAVAEAHTRIVSHEDVRPRKALPASSADGELERRPSTSMDTVHRARSSDRLTEGR